MAEAVLVADADADVRTFLTVVLSLAGYAVTQARDGAEVLTRAVEDAPALVVVDADLPPEGGVDVVRHLRDDLRTERIPVLLVADDPGMANVVTCLQAGADDCVPKPFDPDQVVARVRAQLRRDDVVRTVSPLTGLPGNPRILADLERRIADEEPFALLYADLNDFKALNDHYGFLQGDHALLMFARILVTGAHEAGDARTFVGHVGGDDFVVLCPPHLAEPIAREVCDRLDAEAPALYDAVDRDRGYIEVEDRQGVLRRYPPVSVSIGVATTDRGAFVHPAEAVNVATELKHYVKRHRESGSTWRVDRREEPAAAPVE